MMNPIAQPHPRVLIPLPTVGFDPTEAAVPWRTFRDAGMSVTFATSDGAPAAADPLLLSGILGASRSALRSYREMTSSPEFGRPITWDAIDVASYDAIVLPGGHAPGMRPYLESAVLQSRLAEGVAAGTVVGAICHGVLLLARSRDQATGASVVHDRTITTLPKYMELASWVATAWKLGRHYRTYPEYTADEVRRLHASPGRFTSGPMPWTPFAQRDGNLVTSRWPGDSLRFAEAIVEAIETRSATPPTPT